MILTLDKILSKNMNYIHGNNICAKLKGKNSKEAEKLKKIYENYISRIKAINCRQTEGKIIKEKVRLLNEYYDSFEEGQFDKVFTAKSKLRLTILEEFLSILFEDLIPNIHKKLNSQISIEAKTYIDKTMLEGSIATAEKIKSGNPYAKFYMVSETYEVDQSVDPAYSRIDQIFVLRKSDVRGADKPIDDKVVLALYNEVKTHLTREWGNIKKKLSESGQII